MEETEVLRISEVCARRAGVTVSLKLI